MPDDDQEQASGQRRDLTIFGIKAVAVIAHLIASYGLGRTGAVQLKGQTTAPRATS